MNINIWIKLNNEIKEMMMKNGFTPEMLLEQIEGELNELVLNTSYGYETLFYGNGEAFITVDVDGTDYEFAYVIDQYGDKKYIVNF